MLPKRFCLVLSLFVAAAGLATTQAEARGARHGQAAQTGTITIGAAAAGIASQPVAPNNRQHRARKKQKAHSPNTTTVNDGGTTVCTVNANGAVCGVGIVSLTTFPARGNDVYSWSQSMGHHR